MGQDNWVVKNQLEEICENCKYAEFDSFAFQLRCIKKVFRDLVKMTDTCDKYKVYKSE